MKQNSESCCSNYWSVRGQSSHCCLQSLLLQSCLCSTMMEFFSSGVHTDCHDCEVCLFYLFEVCHSKKNIFSPVLWSRQQAPVSLADLLSCVTGSSSHWLIFHKIKIKVSPPLSWKMKPDCVTWKNDLKWWKQFLYKKDRNNSSQGYSSVAHWNSNLLCFAFHWRTSAAVLSKESTVGGSELLLSVWKWSGYSIAFIQKLLLKDETLDHRDLPENASGNVGRRSFSPCLMSVHPASSSLPVWQFICCNSGYHCSHHI